MTEIDKNKFSLRYFIVGEGAKDWWKAWGTGWRLIITIAVFFLSWLESIKSSFLKLLKPKLKR